jgi:alpha-beta hydrolase superfamily lysophospholipase
VFVLGHSFGAVCAFEAAFQTTKIARLALYEPPVRAGDHSATLARMEEMLRAGDRDGVIRARARRKSLRRYSVHKRRSPDCHGRFRKGNGAGGVTFADDGLL